MLVASAAPCQCLTKTIARQLWRDGRLVYSAVAQSATPALFTSTSSGLPPSRHFCASARTLASDARSSGTASTLAAGTCALRALAPEPPLATSSA